MPRGVTLTPEVERIIADVYVRRPELRGKPQDFHREVYCRVHQEIDWAERNWPGPSVVKKRLATLRENDRSRGPESQGLDEDWSLYSLVRHPVPAEALPFVLRGWVYAREHWSISLTVRQAQWIARLYAVIEDIPTLIAEAHSYAGFELIGELLGIGYESSTIGADLALFEYMIGERLPLERRARVLGVDTELIRGLSLDPHDTEPQLPKELSSEEAMLLTRPSIEKAMKLARVFHLAAKEVESEEEWSERELKLEKMLGEIDPEFAKRTVERRRKRSRPRQAQESKEARNERQHKTKRQE